MEGGTVAGATQIDWAAVTVGAAALGVAIWQGIEFRRYNRLSATPHVSIHRQRSSLGASMEPGLYFINSGVGPAVVKVMRAAVDGKVVASGPPIDWMDAANATDVRDVLVIVRTFQGELWIPAGESVCVIGVPSEGNTDDVQAQLSKMLLKIDVYLEYESVYGGKGEVARTGNWPPGV